MRREEDITFVSLQIVIECLNRLQVEMIGRSIENQTVGIAQLHTGNHTTHLLASRKNTNFFQYFLTGEKHTPQKTFHVHLVAFAILAQPVDQIQIGIEIFGIVQRKISGSNRHSPVEMPGIGFHMPVDDLKESGHRTRIT